MQTATIESTLPQFQDDESKAERLASRPAFDRTTRISARRPLALSEPDEDQPVVSPARRFFVRAVGALAVIGSIAGLGLIVEHEGARHAVIQWGTMGHAADVYGAQSALAHVLD